MMINKLSDKLKQKTIFTLNAYIDSKKIFLIQKKAIHIPEVRLVDSKKTDNAIPE